MTKEYWFRYSDRYDHEPTIFCNKYMVVAHTPKGVWLSYIGDDRKDKFVLNDSRKKWAAPTIEEAWTGFLARKRKQQRILQSQLDNVSNLLSQIPAGPPDPDEGSYTVAPFKSDFNFLLNKVKS